MVCAMHRLFETTAQSVRDDRVMEGDGNPEEERRIREEEEKPVAAAGWVTRLRGFLSLSTEG